MTDFVWGCAAGAWLTLLSIWAFRGARELHEESKRVQEGCKRFLEEQAIRKKYGDTPSCIYCGATDPANPCPTYPKCEGGSR